MRYAFNVTAQREKIMRIITIKLGSERKTQCDKKETKSGIKRETRKEQEQEQPNTIIETLNHLLILVNHNPLGHTLNNLGIKLDCMIPREANLFCEVVGQYIHQISISVGIEKRFVCKLRIFVAQA
jgi:hypothetical protein